MEPLSISSNGTYTLNPMSASATLVEDKTSEVMHLQDFVPGTNTFINSFSIPVRRVDAIAKSWGLEMKNADPIYLIYLVTDTRSGSVIIGKLRVDEELTRKEVPELKTLEYQSTKYLDPEYNYLTLDFRKTIVDMLASELFADYQFAGSQFQPAGNFYRFHGVMLKIIKTNE